MRMVLGKKYLFKIVLYVFLISIIPVTTTGYLLYNKFKSTYTDELLSGEQNIIDHYADLLTQQLDILRVNISAYRTEQKLTSMASSSRKFENYLRFNMINKISSGNIHIKSICYIDAKQEALLTGYGSLPVSHPYIQSLLAFVKDIEGVQVLFFILDNKVDPVDGLDDNKYMYFSYSISDITEKKYVVFEIDYKAMLSSIIRQTGLNLAAEKILLVDSSGSILYQSGGDFHESGQSADYLDMAMITSGEGYQSGNYYIATGIMNKYEGLYIMNMKNVQSYVTKVKILKSQTYLMLAGILLLLIFFAVMIIYILYKPISSLMNHIRRLFPQKESTINNEFETMMVTLKETANRIHNMEFDLESSHMNMRQTVVYSQLVFSNPITCENRILFRDLPSYVTVALIQIRSRSVEEKDMMIPRILELLSRELQYDKFMDQQYGLICVIWLSQSDSQQLVRQLRNLFLPYNDLTEKIQITLGNIYNDLQQIHTSYVQSIYTMDCLVNGSTVKDLVVPYNAIDEMRLNATLEASEKIAGDALTLAYLQQDTKKLVAMVRSQLSPENNIIDQYSFLISAYDLILSTCPGYMEKVEVISRFSDMLILDKKVLPSLGGLLLEHLIKPDMPLKPIDKSIEYLTTIIHYIEENYNQDIPLESLAKLAGISPQYVCHIIKSHTGLSFTQYVNSIRIEKSKKIILDGAVAKVDKLYMQVGFNSQSYFTKVFKNITGMSPGFFIKRYT